MSYTLLYVYCRLRRKEKWRENNRNRLILLVEAGGLTGVVGTLAIGAVGTPSIPPIAAILTVASILSLVAAYVALLSFRNTVVSTRRGLA
jgi:hypothetical protein